MTPPFGLVLAGGAARRMGGCEKPLLRFGDGTLISAVIARVAPQCQSLAINTAGHDHRWADYPYDLLPDAVTPRVGPLGGVLAGLEYLSADPGVEQWLLTVPGDTPFLPSDLVQRLDVARRCAETLIVCSASCGRSHPVVALWSTQVRASLVEALRHRGQRSVRDFQAEIGVAVAEWSATPVDPFFNVNTPADLVEAERSAGVKAV